MAEWQRAWFANYLFYGAAHGRDRHAGGNTEMAAYDRVLPGEGDLATGAGGYLANALHEVREGGVDIEICGGGCGCCSAREIGSKCYAQRSRADSGRVVAIGIGASGAVDHERASSSRPIRCAIGARARVCLGFR